MGHVVGMTVARIYPASRQKFDGMRPVLALSTAVALGDQIVEIAFRHVRQERQQRPRRIESRRILRERRPRLGRRIRNLVVGHVTPRFRPERGEERFVIVDRQSANGHLVAGEQLTVQLPFLVARRQ